MLFLARIFTLVFGLVFGSTVLVVGQSRLIYVNKTTGKDTSIAGTKTLPFAKIQTGIDSARNGDTVFVARGTYVENVDIKGKSIALISSYFYSNDTTDIVNTRIDGNLNGSYGLFVNGTSYVDGFNIRNSYPGGVFVSVGGSTLRNLITEYNQGNGISIQPPGGAPQTLISNLITRYNQGAGFLEFIADVKINNVLAHQNGSYGLHLQSGIDTISNAIVYGNLGGGLWVWNSNSTLSHFTIFDNRQDAFWSHANGFLKIYNSILWANDRSGRITDARALIYNSVIENGATGISRNIETFLTYDSSNNSRNPNFIDTASKNFQIGSYSSALGIGVQESFFPVVDILGNVRPNPSGSAPDAGAYENIYKHQPAEIISGEGGNQSVRLRWTQSPGSRLARYKVFRSTSPIADNATGGVVTDTIGVTSKEYVDGTGLTNLTKYYYRMKTIDSAGVESGMSNEVSVTPNVLPSIPSGIVLEKGPGRIGIKWTLSTDSNIKYELLRRGKDSTVQTLFSNNRVSSFIDSNIIIGDFYQYAVRSIDQFGVKSLITFSNSINANQLIFVSKNGNDSALGSIESPVLTINRALSFSKNNDTVIVNPGIYLERIVINKKVVFGSQFILTSDTSFRSKTIIDGQSGGTVIRTDVAGIKIMGITIQNGYSSQGGGIFGSNLELDHVVIRKCRGVGDVDGGGAFLVGRVKITNSLFEENVGRKGGALTLSPSNDTIFISNSVFKYNNGWENGSGIIAFGNLSSIVLVKNCVFDKNVGGSSVIHNQGSKTIVYNSNLVNNTVSSMFMFNGNIEVYNSILRNSVNNEVQSLIGPNPGSVLINYSNVKGGYAGIGNIDYDPEFVDSNLLIIKNSSPLIGNGINSVLVNSDYFGLPRPNPAGSLADIGAYESLFKHASPIVVSAEGGDKSVRLKWTQAPGTRLAKFKIFRSTSPIGDNATGGVVTDTIGVGRFEFVDATGLTNLTKYYYRMKTIDSAGVESGMSNEVSVVPNVLSAKVSDFRVSGSSRMVGVRWTSRSGFKYNVYRGTDKSVLNLIAKEVADSSYQDSIVIKNQRYYYNVRSVDSLGVPGVASDTLEVQTAGYFYVSPEGSDLDGGSSSSPFKTIRRALQLAQSTDTIILKQGVYGERLNIRHTQRPLTIASEYLLNGDTSVISKTIFDGSTLPFVTVVYDSTVVYGGFNNSYNSLIGFTMRGVRGAILDGTSRWNVRKMTFTANNPNAYLLQNVNRLNVDSSLFFGNGNENSATGLVYVRDSGSLRNSIIRDNQLEGHAFVSDGGNMGDSVVVSGNIFTRTRHRYYWSHAAIVNTSNTYNFIIRDNVIANNDRNAFIYLYMADRTDCKAYVYNNSILNNNTQWDNYGSLLISSRIQSEVYIYNNIIQNNKSNNTRLQVAINPEGNQATVGRISILNNVIGSDTTTAKINNLNLLDVRRNTGNTFNAVSFVDSARGDYRLQNWSWGIGMGYAGTDLPRSPRDFAGTVRPNPSGSLPDLGALENTAKHASPVVVLAEGGNGSARLRWTQIPGNRISRYKVFRSTSPIGDNSTAGIITDTIGVTSKEYVDGTGLTNLTKYYYRMKTIDSAGVESGMSNEVSVIPNTLSSKPTGLVTNTGARTAQIKWTRSPVLKYEVFRGDSRQLLTMVASNLVDSVYVDSSLNRGTTYYYALRGVDSVGVKGNMSDTLTVTTDRYWYVSTDGSDVQGGGSGSPFKTIRRALQLAQSTDTIILKQGVYGERLNIRHTQRPLTIASEYLFTGDTSLISKTILDGSTSLGSPLIYDSTVAFGNANNLYHQMIGFTIRGSRVPVLESTNRWNLRRMHFTANVPNNYLLNYIPRLNIDSSVFFKNGTENSATSLIHARDSASVRNSVFNENQLEGHLFLSDGGTVGDSVVLAGNIFTRTRHRYYWSHQLMIHSANSYDFVFRDNVSTGNVGNASIYIYMIDRIDYRTNVYNNTIVNNNTQNGGWGAIMISSRAQSDINIYNNIIQNNRSADTRLQVNVNPEGSHPVIAKLNILNNVIGTDSSTAKINNLNLLDVRRNTGNTFNAVNFVDSARGDYRLQNWSWGIGMGYAGTDLPRSPRDFAGTVRPNPSGSLPDLGALENTAKHASPVVVLAEGGNGSARLRWTQIPGNRISRYKVFRSTSPIGDNSTAGIITDTIGVTSKEYVDGTGLTNLTKYYYRMKTIDSAGVESGMSNEVSVIPNTLSSKPTGLVTNTGARTAQIKWTRSPVLKYEVFRGDSRQLLTMVASNLVDSVYVDSSLNRGTTYYYALRGVDSVGVKGNMSDTLTVTTDRYWYVSPDGSDVQGGGSGSPFKTIRRALQLAQSSDTIILKQGVYGERLNIRHTQRPLTIASEYLLNGDTSVISKTILDASTVQSSPLIYDSTVVYGNANNLYHQMIGFTITKTRGAVLDGPNRWNVRKMVFTANNANAYLLQNVNRLNVDSSLFFGNGNENSATGLVYVRDSGSLRNSIIRDNQLEGHAFVSDGGNMGDSVVVSGNIFTRTRHRYYWSHAAIVNTSNTYNFIIRDNVIANNDRNAFIYLYMADRTDCKAYVYNNSILNNNTQWDNYGSLLISSRIQSEVYIYNNIIQNNKSNNTRLQIAINLEGSQPTVGRINILNNVIGSDTTTAKINNLNLLDVRRNTGNTFNAVNFVDSARGDYRLQNWSWGIGMGYAGTDLPRSPRDFAGTVRPNPSGSLPDLGAFENALSVSTAYLDNIQRSGDSVFIPWNFNDRASIDSVIILRSTNQNVESGNPVRRAIIVSPNQLVIKDTLSSSLVHYYAVRVRLKNGSYTALSNVKASNALAKKASFLPQMVNPRFAWGDIDADGDLDLAVMGETPGIFFQLYRNANGTFTEVFDRTKTPQLFKGAMKFADIDNDGDIDLIASGQRTTAINNLGTFLFRNDGKGNFTFNEVLDIVSTREGDMAFGDHDNDGDLDMALSGIDVNGLSRLTVYNNNGKGTFSIERRLFPSQGGPSDPLYSDLQWVDYDNDGDQDLIFSGRASGSSAGIVTNTLFNRNQTNNFSGSNIRYYGEWALRNAALEAADINADGWVDIVASGSVESGTVLTRQTRIIYGSPNGFQTASWLPLDNIAGQVRVADYDNDGDLDILVSGTDQQANPRTVFYLNTGSGLGFDKKTYEIIPNLDRSAFSWADYDNDGDLDLVISGQKPAAQGGQVLSEIYTFEPERKNISPTKPAKPTIQNFGDGRIIVSWSNGVDDLTPANSLNYLLKIGTVSLTGIPAASYTVVEANKNGGTLLNPETGLIYGTQYFTQLNPGRYYFLLQVVDHNKLTSLPSDTLFLTLAYPWKFVNQGGIADATIAPNSRLSAKWGDIDRDNDYDFLYGNGLFESNKNNYTQSNYQFDEGYLLNQGGDQSLLKPNIKWHDVTQDGVADLIVTSTEPINPSNATYAKFRLNIFKNDPRLSETGRGRLSRLSLGAEDSIYLGNTRFKVTDLNNDGKPDILLAGVDKTTQSKVHVFTTGPLTSDKNTPPGFKFSRLKTNLDSILLAQSSYDLEFDFGDVDGDSDNDFVAFYKNELGDLLSRTYLNNGVNLTTGKITFVQSTSYVFEPLDNASLDLLDYDKDGDLDLMTSGRSFSSGQQFNIFESKNGSFVKVVNPIRPFENAKLSFGDINNDGYSDLIYTGTREGSGLISKIAVFNPTTKGFEEQSQFLFGEEFSDLNIEFGDFDADSDLDILVNGTVSGTNPVDIFRVYKNVQNESARVIKALGTTTNSSPLLSSQENITTESSTKSFLTVLNDATLDNQFVENNAPTTPLNLTEKIISKNGEIYKVRFSWDAASDDHTPADGLSYELRVGSAPGISDEVVSLSLPSGYRMVPEEGNTGRKRVWDIDLKPGTYFWSAQSVDASFAGSSFAEERTFTVDQNGQICDVSIPIVSFNSPLSFCEGDSVVFVAGKRQNIQWFKNDVLIETATDSVLKVFTTGTYKSRYANAACISSFSNPIIVTVNPRPGTAKVDVSANEVCAGTVVVLTSSLDSVYQWFRNDVVIPGLTTQRIEIKDSGSYSFISKINGCFSQKSPSVNIVVKPLPTAAFSMSANTICEGTNVTLTATTGNGYTYQWLKNGSPISGATSPTYTTNTTGRYSLSVALDKCNAVASSDTLTVTPTPVAGNLTASAATVCQGNTITLTASTDSVYQWFRNDNVITGSIGKTINIAETGSYSYTRRINGCISPRSNVVNATVNAIPTSTFTMSSSSICEGSKVTLTASTGTGYTYQWLKNGVNITGATSSTYSAGEAGRYSVLVSNNGCSALSGTDSLTVTSIPGKPSINKEGTELVSSSATGNVWYQDGSLIQGATQQRYKPTANANYSVKVRNNGCESVLSETFYFLVTALVDLGNDQYIKAYPNPLTNGQDLIIDWKLSGLNETIRAEVFDVTGKRIVEKRLTRNNNRISINSERGVYYVVLSWGQNQRQTIRIMKQ